MIHFCCSISITDTYRVYQYHKLLIHYCDTFTESKPQLILELKASTDITILLLMQTVCEVGCIIVHVFCVF